MGDVLRGWAVTVIQECHLPYVTKGREVGPGGLEVSPSFPESTGSLGTHLYNEDYLRTTGLTRGGDRHRNTTTPFFPVLRYQSRGRHTGNVSRGPPSHQSWPLSLVGRDLESRRSSSSLRNLISGGRQRQSRRRFPWLLSWFGRHQDSEGYCRTSWRMVGRWSYPKTVQLLLKVFCTGKSPNRSKIRW